MKLAEALILRADTQKRIVEIRQRAVRNAKVQEGSHPSEDPQALLTQLREMYTQLTSLIQRINRTNTVTSFDETLSMADALAVRDTMGSRQAMLRELAQASTPSQDRFTRTEIRFESVLDAGALQQEADQLARQRRELDTRVQELNWLTDLVA
ncbi:MAG: DIP1984 family protein [Caldilineaceae bacterium]|nr:DIP1984 family protein [Caldilineaceae bacterium]MBP8109741.1 DIP1984 family protein [Caldilineaceae bacterium]MBP8121401.1 DIP1984 family protein [Caldilineaceae bacterium]MBP9072703.1 DIP1984 family protein [Caldilineaceae bacterium]